MGGTFSLAENKETFMNKFFEKRQTILVLPSLLGNSKAVHNVVSEMKKASGQSDQRRCIGRFSMKSPKCSSMCWVTKSSKVKTQAFFHSFFMIMSPWSPKHFMSTEQSLRKILGCLTWNFGRWLQRNTGRSLDDSSPLPHVAAFCRNFFFGTSGCLQRGKEEAPGCHTKQGFFLCSTRHKQVKTYVRHYCLPMPAPYLQFLVNMYIPTEPCHRCHVCFGRCFAKFGHQM